MDNAQKGRIVISCYQPKPGQQQELIELLRDHVPNLRMLGLASGYPRTLMLAENGTVIEIFEWESEEASRTAHDHPEVRKIWDAVGKLADFVPLNSLPESQKPFSPFSQVENDRKHRVTWFEIQADEPAKVTQFYKQVFGWEFSRWGEEEYWMADTGREPCPGIDGAVLKRKMRQQSVTNTISVESIDDAIQKVEKAGGKIVVPKMSMEWGYLAYGSDTEGNLFGMIQMKMAAT